MPYATEADAITLYGEDYVIVASDRDDDGDVDGPSLDQALVSASSEIDTYLGVRYDLPIPSTAVDALQYLKRVAVDIAIYALSPGALSRTDEKRTRYEDAIKWLTNVSTAKAVLPGMPGEGDGTIEGQPGAVLISEPRLFTRGKMRGIY